MRGSTYNQCPRTKDASDIDWPFCDVIGYLDFDQEINSRPLFHVMSGRGLGFKSPSSVKKLALHLVEIAGFENWRMSEFSRGELRARIMPLGIRIARYWPIDYC